MNKFLGRKLNPNTMMYEHSDGSGASMPEEIRQDFLCDIVNPVGGSIVALDRIWKFKKKAKEISNYDNRR